MDRTKPARRFQLAVKRLMDILLCLGLVLLVWPLLLVIAVAVKLTSPGPILFIQERVGRDQQAYRILKFRTMTDAPAGQSHIQWTDHDEARITPLGRFLRDYGLDELPQIFNILKGDMSIVGPRPPLPAQAQRFSEEQKTLFRMRPGVLSLAAVEGRRSIPLSQRIELHVLYVDTWSLRLDIRVVWRALFVVLARKDTEEVTGPSEADSSGA